MLLLILLIAVLALTLGISYYVYRIAFYASPGKRCGIDDPLRGSQFEAVAEHIYRVGHIMEKYPCEEVSIYSLDGYILHGRYYHLKDGAPIQILMHGYRSCAFRDCGGAHWLSRKMGFNALVIDQRAHGESEGNIISFGIREHQDCAQWIHYCNTRFGPDIPIILWGVSMGAATALMSLGEKLPKNLTAVIADSPYSSPKAILEKVCADQHYSVAIFRPFICVAAWFFGGFRLNSVTAKETVSKSSVPILLIHGEDDRLVPYSMSLSIARHCKSANVRVEIFPDAGHGLCYLTDPSRYERVIYEFLSTIPSVAGKIEENFVPERTDI